MANPTLSDLRTRVRANVRDNSATAGNRALSDAAINGYINLAVRMVQQRYAPRPTGQSATQTGLSYSTNGFSGNTTLATYSRLISVMLVASAGDVYGVPLVWKEPDEFMNLRAGQSSTSSVSDAGTASAANPVYWTAWREGTETAANQGKWRVLIHPPATSAALLSALVEFEHADLSSDGDSPDVPPEGSSLIELIASYLSARDLGRANADAFLAIYPDVKAEVEWKVRDELRDRTRETRAKRAG